MGEPEIVGVIVERIMGELAKTIMERNMNEDVFWEKGAEMLAVLQEQIESLRKGPGTPEGFYDLYKAMEGYRDHVWHFLLSLPGRDRRPIQAKLPHEIFDLINEAMTLANEACERQVIDKDLALGIGMMNNCIAMGAGVSIHWPDN
jgi:hypothetical protein